MGFIPINWSNRVTKQRYTSLLSSVCNYPVVRRRSKMMSTNKSDSSNPCQNVRTTCKRWMEQEERSVRIRKEHLPRLAKDILEKKKNSPSWIEWDEEKWHYSGVGYQGSESQKRERVALYILALDAINFCFWPQRNGEKENNKMEYHHLAIALKKMAEADDDPADAAPKFGYAFSPRNLASMTPEKMESLLEPHLEGHYLDNISKRSSLWNELGTSLLEIFDGSATQLLVAGRGHAPNLVDLITTHLPGFRDQVLLDGEQIWFLKRAQIFAGDVNAALNLGLSGMDDLTTFADYRVPQILRHFDILEYSPSLGQIVDTEQEIVAGSTDEISIRAATVTAVDDLVEYLNSTDECKQDTFTAVTVDWYLWQVGERMHQERALKPFHKVRTHFY
jgi:hypothetical protein